MTDPADLDRFTRGSIASRQRRLSPPLQGLHRAVLRRFLQTGAAPTARWVRQAAAGLGLPGSAAGQLEAADAIHIVDGIVAVAYPFSGVPTRHLVELDGLPAVYAMCALDALGLPLMAGRDGRITSTDPHGGATIMVSLRDSAWTWTPASAVVVIARAAGCDTDCSSFEVMCPNTVFHASPETAQACLAGHGGLDAQILDQATAVERGRVNFGSLLSELTRPATAGPDAAGPGRTGSTA
jgi:alkylmercury lyase